MFFFLKLFLILTHQNNTKIPKNSFKLKIISNTRLDPNAKWEILSVFHLRPFPKQYDAEMKNDIWSNPIQSMTFCVNFSFVFLCHDS
jgi:hypothetical protein